jgi:hypothetical protein
VATLLTVAIGWSSPAVAQAVADTTAAAAAAVIDTTSAVGDTTAGVSTMEAVADSTAPTLPPAAVIEPIDVWDTGVSPTAAVLMTPVFPGWGQLYTDNSWRAALAFGLEMFYWSNLLANDRRAVRDRDFSHTLPEDDFYRGSYYARAEENWERMRDYAWWSGGVLLIIALDAYVGAHLFDFEEDPVPVPNHWDEGFGDAADDMPGSHGAPSLVIWQHGWRF